MTDILNVQNLHKTFEAGTPNENHVLKGIDLQMNEGDFISIIGGNGAGKSTFLNSIAGSFSVDRGQIVLEDKNITELPANQRAKYISRVFQDTRMGTASRLTIEENLSVAMKRGQKRGLSRGIKAKDRDFFKQELKKLQLGLENRLSMDVGLLSGGQRQALTLLMATIVTPKVLLLDEHTAALDPKTSEMVTALTDQLVYEKGISTLMITHNMQHAIEQGNRLIMLHEGNIVVDVRGEEKQNLTVMELVNLFQTKSGADLSDDSLILG
jgi:putative ABC transport system ATP-binding protein